MIRSRLLATLALAVTATGMVGCGSSESPAPPPDQQGTPPADDQRGYPNLGTVPQRPQTSTAADRAAVAGQLTSDRARARYGADTQPVDETRGSTIGSVVRGKPRQAEEPEREPAGAPTGGAPREAAPASEPAPTAAPR